MNFRLRLILILIIVLVSCTINQYSSIYKGINLFALFNDRSDHQIIIVDSIAGIGTGTESAFAVSGAEVYVNGQNIPFIDSLGYYGFNEHIGYGDTYILQLYYNGDTIIDTTFIPDSMYLYYPVSHMPMHLDTQSFAMWSGKNMIFMIDIRESGNDSFSTISMYQFFDTIMPLFPYSSFLDSGVYYDFICTAMDINYLEYLFGDNEMENNRGVFGSFVSAMAESILIIK